MRKRYAALALLAVVALLSAACQRGGGEEGVVKIGFIGPLTGPLGAFGTGMRNSAQLAIDQANREGKVEGWKIELEALDDAGQAQQGSTAARRLASDSRVVAVIGTLNSSVAQAVQPVLDPAGIAMVSPANTNPTLTMGLEWKAEPKRAFPTYFRVVATDREQGQFAAQYAREELKRSKAVVMHDKKTYGQGLSSIFTESFQKGGGQVLETIEINPGEGDYKPAVTQAKSNAPDIVYYGGEFPEAGVLAKNMAELGMKAPEVILMGGDGIVDAKFVEIGGAGAEGHYATLVGATADFLPAANQFVKDYEAAGFKEPFSAYGPPTYDSANIIIAALSEVLPGKTGIDTSVRKAVVEAIQGLTYKGALGTTSFNKFGDTSNRLLTVNRVEQQRFQALKAESL